MKNWWNHNQRADWPRGWICFLIKGNWSLILRTCPSKRADCWARAKGFKWGVNMRCCYQMNWLRDLALVTATFNLTLKNWNEKRTLQPADLIYWGLERTVVENEVKLGYRDLWSWKPQEGAVNSDPGKVMNAESEMSHFKELVNSISKTGCNAWTDQFLKRQKYIQQGHSIAHWHKYQSTYET